MMSSNLVRIVPAFAIALLVAAAWGPSDASAQSIRADGRIGVAVPVGDLADIQDAGVSFGAGVGYPIFHDRIFLRGDFDANMLSGQEVSDDGVTLESEGISVYTVAGGLSVDLLGPESPWSAFVYGGVGPSILSVEGADSETRFSASGAVKAGRSVGPAWVGLRAKVHRIGLDEEEFGTDGWTLGQLQGVVQITF